MFRVSTNLGINQTSRPTWTEIDLDVIRANFESVRNFVGREYKYLAVVKADAYGHGAIECAKELEKAGVDWLGVAIIEEAIQLRKAGIKRPILCFGGVWNGQEAQFLEYNITPVVLSLEQASILNSFAESKGRRMNFHLKIDTGMNRVGVRFESLPEFVEGIAELNSIRLEGVMTHFATADDLDEIDFTNRQIQRFEAGCRLLQEKGFNPELLDLANSPGSIVHPNARGNMVRLGGVLYGLGDDILPKGIPLPELKPALSLHTRIALIKELPKGESIGYGRTFITKRKSVIASIPIGYDDGFSRRLSGKSSALLRGKRMPIVGRISMDWLLVDITDLAGKAKIEVGERVTLIGESGEEKILAADLAGESNTISYEITCGIGNRVRREFLKKV